MRSVLSKIAQVPLAKEGTDLSEDGIELLDNLIADALEHAKASPSVRASAFKLTSRPRVQDTILNRSISRYSSRLLPGAKIVRSGRVMTDIMKKIKKRMRKQLWSAMIKYRKSVKAPQKALVTQTRKQAVKAYK